MTCAEVRDLEAWHTGAAEYPVLQFNGWKINLHPIVTPATPRAAASVPGSVDLCLRWTGPISEVAAHLRSRGVAIELGPVPQEGAQGAASSVYLRDPDDNLLEFISYELEAPSRMVSFPDTMTRP